MHRNSVKGTAVAAGVKEIALAFPAFLQYSNGKIKNINYREVA